MTNPLPDSIILETNRLRLRRMMAEDILSLTDLWTDPAVTRHLGGPREKSWLIGELEAAARNPLAEPFDLWPLIEKETGLVVGHCGLLEKEVDGVREVEVNYILAASAWGRGYATEIARALLKYGTNTMGQPRLIALIDPDNAASEQVAQKAGMRLEKETLRPGGMTRRVYVFPASEL
jgi:[ribosomal protein S5]-alanine N-acetyltransferase